MVSTPVHLRLLGRVPEAQPVHPTHVHAIVSRWVVLAARGAAVDHRARTRSRAAGAGRTGEILGVKESSMSTQAAGELVNVSNVKFYFICKFYFKIVRNILRTSLLCSYSPGRAPRLAVAALARGGAGSARAQGCTKPRFWFGG